MEKLMKILTEARPDLDFSKEEFLVDHKVLDSFDIIMIIGEINDQFNISLNAADLLPENFNTAEAIWETIQRRL